MATKLTAKLNEIYVYTIILIILIVLVITVFLIEVQLVCCYTNSIYTFVEDVKIVKIGIAKTHMSAFKKSGKYLAHWDIICQDENGNYYFVYATKPLKKNLGQKCITEESDVVFRGTRTVYIQAYDKMNWKYKVNKLYTADTTLFEVAKEYNKQLSQKYNVLYNNCYHSARKTINTFHPNAIQKKEFTLVKTIVDLKNIM